MDSPSSSPLSSPPPINITVSTSNEPDYKSYFTLTRPIGDVLSGAQHSPSPLDVHPSPVHINEGPAHSTPTGGRCTCIASAYLVAALERKGLEPVDNGAYNPTLELRREQLSRLANAPKNPQSIQPWDIPTIREAVIAFDEAGYKDRIVRDVYDDLMNLDSDDSQASEAPNPLGLPSSLREWERRMTLFAHAMLPTQASILRDVLGVTRTALPEEMFTTMSIPNQGSKDRLVRVMCWETDIIIPFLETLNGSQPLPPVTPLSALDRIPSTCRDNPVDILAVACLELTARLNRLSQEYVAAFMANEYREAEEIHRAMHATLTVMGALRNHSEMAHSKWRLHKLNM